jgi:hypothetical protein
VLTQLGAVGGGDVDATVNVLLRPVKLIKSSLSPMGVAFSKIQR